MQRKITVEDWIVAPPDDVLRNLAGFVLNVCVGGDIGPGPTPFGEFFRFARVISVEVFSPGVDAARCTRCESAARYRITVEWEAGYKCPEGNVLCEQCIDGIVTGGAEAIPFGADLASDVTYEICLKIDLGRKGKSDG